MRTMATILVSALLLLCAAQGLGQTTVSQAQVWRAVARDVGIKEQESLEILGPEVRVPDQARLRVATVHAVSDGTLLLRMECSSRTECLPFEVVLRRGSEQAGGAGAGSSSVPSPGRAAAPLVRAGQRVELAEEVSGMRLCAPAVSLQTGAMGQRIRVRNVSSGRVVLARVRAAGQVVVEN